jgi:hypothetical protein
MVHQPGPSYVLLFLVFHFFGALNWPSSRALASALPPNSSLPAPW